ncbi:hypothetical protein V8E55_008315, partial [Tylopilus felleus]
FQILVIGRANAGKTTLLQRVCRKTESPIIHDWQGNEIGTDVKGTDEVGRGEHDIEHEISFRSNDHFVFHDSHGFEAGSEDELHIVQSFIEEQANKQDPEEHLHSIWFKYCISMEDHSRPITVAEETFFSKCGTGKVPVIAIFTKFDALHAIAYGELRDQHIGLREAVALAPEHAKEIFKCNEYYSMLQVMKFLPGNKSSIVVEGINKEKADCSALLMCTAKALDNEVLEMLLVSAQQVNLNICVEYAVRRKVKVDMFE